MAVVLGVLVVAFFSFYLYSRTPAWGQSETRKAMLRVLVVIGPIFGMHYREPRPEIPTISTPGGDAEPAVSGVRVPPPPDAESGSGS
jgi:hypothetical protein